MNHLSAADILCFPNKVCGTSKPRIRLVRIVRHDREQLIPGRGGTAHLFKSLLKGAERAAEGKPNVKSLISLTPPSYCKWYS